MVRIILLWIVAILLLGCEHRAEILMVPLGEGDLQWVATESSASLLASHIEDEAKWLVAQSLARAECMSAAAHRSPEIITRESKTTPSPRNDVASTRAPQRRTIDLNTASSRQLQRLPRVGPVLAQAIIDARPYGSVHDLRRVKGVGAKTFESMEPLLTVSGADED